MTQAASRPTILVHGGAVGAGTARFEKLASEGCVTAAHAGWAVLQDSGHATDAVVEAIKVLETDPLFNVGRGAVSGRKRLYPTRLFHHGWWNSLSSGRDWSETDQTCHSSRPTFDGRTTLLSSRRGGPAIRCSRWHSRDPRGGVERQARRGEGFPKEAVGCVALDDRGRLAAGTSTGGLSNRPDGRTGDSGVLGAGTWSTKDGAASATGTGEDILRVQLCSTAVRLLDKHSPMEAAQLAIGQMDELSG